MTIFTFLFSTSTRSTQFLAIIIILLISQFPFSSFLPFLHTIANYHLDFLIFLKNVLMQHITFFVTMKYRTEKTWKKVDDVKNSTNIEQSSIHLLLKYAHCKKKITICGAFSRNKKFLHFYEFYLILYCTFYVNRYGRMLLDILFLCQVYCWIIY